MKVWKTVYNYCTYPINRIGLLTKKNCVDIATNIGCKLYDIEKDGKVITDEILSNVIKQEAPHIKLPNLVTTRKQAIETSIKNGYPKEIAEYTFDNVKQSGAFAYYSPLFEGIYITKYVPKSGDYRYQLFHVISHEMEHYLYKNYNPKIRLRNLYARIFKKANKNSIPTVEEFKKYLSNPNKNITYRIQKDFFEYFGTLPNQLDKYPIKCKSGEKAVLKLLQTPFFWGLTNTKRLDAYIRSIIRANIHPHNGQINILKSCKQVFEDEARAYKVTENVINHSDGVNNITPYGVRSYVFERASKILEREIKIAMIYNKIKKIRHIPSIKTSLPSNSYIGK